MGNEGLEYDIGTTSFLLLVSYGTHWFTFVASAPCFCSEKCFPFHSLLTICLVLPNRFVTYRLVLDATVLWLETVCFLSLFFPGETTMVRHAVAASTLFRSAH